MPLQDQDYLCGRCAGNPAADHGGISLDAMGLLVAAGESRRPTHPQPILRNRATGACSGITRCCSAQTRRSLTPSRLRRLIRGLVVSTLLGPLVALGAAPAGAKPVSMQFRFTPYLPAARDVDKVTTVPGVVELELNGVPMAEGPLEQKSALVMNHDAIGIEVFPALWLPASQLQPLLRRGHNLLRIRFTPKDGRVSYRSQFRWEVIDDAITTSTTAEGSEVTTNHAARGGEDREVRGAVRVQHAFQAPFAQVEPWHDAPAVNTLEPADRAAIMALISERASLFAPDFEAAHRFIANQPTDRGVTINVPEARRLRCLEAGYTIGVRVAAPTEADVRLITTDSPVLVARGTGELLFGGPHEPGMAERYEALPNDIGFCFMLTFNSLFPKQFLLVKGKDGQWQILP
ncbi:hypothetical protein [Cyanobium sp. CH-040]|uniref:hypothetical protein n=1 Tax=Cyanobium sp. CH-040 TaxID=2823708 RepID=UPI0020CDF3B6|nr:hypothetical protein [Cyanobium sp. CH-040]MCP9927453.1 hypothetical protein [Cyanobium sp. CH-040]